MYSDSLKLKQNIYSGDIISIVEDGFLRKICYPNLPVGTKIIRFKAKEHGFEGAKVSIHVYGQHLTSQIEQSDIKTGLCYVHGAWRGEDEIQYLILK